MQVQGKRKSKKAVFSMIFAAVAMSAIVVYLSTRTKNETPLAQKTWIMALGKEALKKNTRVLKEEQKLEYLAKYRNMFGSPNGFLSTEEEIEEPLILTEEEKDALEKKYEKLNDLDKEIYRFEAHRILDEMLQEEPKDSHWESELESFIQENQGEDIYEGTEFTDVDCGIQLCKIVTLHTNADSFKKYVTFGCQLGPLYGDQNGRQETLENGQIQATMYISRGKSNYSPFQEMQDRLIAWIDSQQ